MRTELDRHMYSYYTSRFDQSDSACNLYNYYNYIGRASIYNLEYMYTMIRLMKAHCIQFIISLY